MFANIFSTTFPITYYGPKHTVAAPGACGATDVIRLLSEADVTAFGQVGEYDITLDLGVGDEGSYLRSSEPTVGSVAGTPEVEEFHRALLRQQTTQRTIRSFEASTRKANLLPLDACISYGLALWMRANCRRARESARLGAAGPVHPRWWARELMADLATPGNGDHVYHAAAWLSLGSGWNGSWRNRGNSLVQWALVDEAPWENAEAQVLHASATLSQEAAYLYEWCVVVYNLYCAHTGAYPIQPVVVFAERPDWPARAHDFEVTPDHWQELYECLGNASCLSAGNQQQLFLSACACCFRPHSEYSEGGYLRHATLTFDVGRPVGHGFGGASVWYPDMTKWRRFDWQNAIAQCGVGMLLVTLGAQGAICGALRTNLIWASAVNPPAAVRRWQREFKRDFIRLPPAATVGSAIARAGLNAERCNTTMGVVCERMFGTQSCPCAATWASAFCSISQQLNRTRCASANRARQGLAAAAAPAGFWFILGRFHDPEFAHAVGLPTNGIRSVFGLHEGDTVAEIRAVLAGDDIRNHPIALAAILCDSGAYVRGSGSYMRWDGNTGDIDDDSVSIGQLGWHLHGSLPKPYAIRFALAGDYEVVLPRGSLAAETVVWRARGALSALGALNF